jgi:hypothetical protein
MMSQPKEENYDEYRPATPGRPVTRGPSGAACGSRRDALRSPPSLPPGLTDEARRTT